MWIDSHCHITADRFDEDRQDALDRAFEGGVETLISIGSGYGIRGNADAVRLAESDRRIFAAVGVHPHEAAELDEANRVEIRQWLDHERVVALGECGLDYHYMNSPRETQLAVFAEQIALARELAMPVSVHVRDDEPNAYDDLLEIWLAEGRGELEGVLHCYTGTLEFETDAPFLAPQGHRGKRNEPLWVSVVGETLAELHGCSVEEIAQRTTANTRQLFRLPSATSDPT